MAGSTRNLGLDFFRGLALIFIFIDHIPGNLVSTFTPQNFGFSDAAEVFVFISGFTAALVFGRVFARDGFVLGSAQVLRRVWTLYVAHVFVFVIFMAEVSWASQRFANPMFADEMRMASFLAQPHVAVIQALMLNFQPSFMDILPLYIVLLIGFIPAIQLARWRPGVLLALSAACYALVPVLNLRISTYPHGEWFFNPFAWQFIFTLGIVMGWAYAEGRPMPYLAPRWLAVSLPLVVAGLVLKQYWIISAGHDAVPAWMPRLLGPVLDKTDLGPLRLIHFLALAHVVQFAATRAPGFLNTSWAAPIVRAGQHSLYIFCLGVFLSFIGHTLLVEVMRSALAHVAVSVAGILIMLGVAQVMTWYRGRVAAAKRGAA